MKLLVTAGPTREFLDPVRFLSNRSTGRMGYAVAERAAARGHDVVLVSGPVSLEPPAGVRIRRIVSALALLTAVQDELPACDALVMTAAVADWRPETVSSTKLKKNSATSATPVTSATAFTIATDGESATLRLVRNPDILATIRPLKGDRRFVGFAAETDHVLEEASKKLFRKGLDLVVANDVTRPGAGFEVDTNIVTFVTPNAAPIPLPLLSKSDVADKIIDWLEH